MLQALLERLNHRRSVVAVDEAMVEGGGQIHGAADRDGAIDHHRALDGAVDADDGYLGSIDDRGTRDAAELAEAGDGDGRTAELFTRRLVVARRLAHPAHF